MSISAHLLCIDSTRFNESREITDTLETDGIYRLYVYDKYGGNISLNVIGLDIIQSHSLLAPVVNLVFLFDFDKNKSYTDLIDEITIRILQVGGGEIKFKLKSTGSFSEEKDALADIPGNVDENYKVVMVSGTYTVPGAFLLRSKKADSFIYPSKNNIRGILSTYGVKVNIPENQFNEYPKDLQEHLKITETDIKKQIAQAVFLLPDKSKFKTAKLLTTENKLTYKRAKTIKISQIESYINDIRFANPVRFSFDLNNTFNVYSLKYRAGSFLSEKFKYFISPTHEYLQYPQIKNKLVQIRGIPYYKAQVINYTKKEDVDKNKLYYCNLHKTKVTLNLSFLSYDVKYELTFGNFISEVLGYQYYTKILQVLSKICSKNTVKNVHEDTLNITAYGNLTTKQRTAAYFYNNWYSTFKMNILFYENLPDPQIFIDPIWYTLNYLMIYNVNFADWFPMFITGYRATFIRESPLAPIMKTSVILNVSTIFDFVNFKVL